MGKSIVIKRILNKDGLFKKMVISFGYFFTIQEENSLTIFPMILKS